MANHINTGKKGEELAAVYLLSNGYIILHKNWRYSHYEIDLIASRQNILHFIEVKARRSSKFGFPEESVGTKKLRNLINAADEFLHQYPHWKRVQFDVLSISIGKEIEYFFIEDVYV